MKHGNQMKKKMDVGLQLSVITGKIKLLLISFTYV